MYYHPTADGAFDSIQYITDTATLGWLVRGMHKWGSSIFVILLFLHMGRVFLMGSYKYPREMTWLTGALLFLWSCSCRSPATCWCSTSAPTGRRSSRSTSTARRRSWGRTSAEFLKVGPEFSQNTLSRFYSLHMLAVPGGIMALIGLHLYLVIRLGVTSPPWSKHRAKAGEV